MQDYKSTKRMLNEEAKNRIKQKKPYIINMTVNDDSSFLSEFSVNDTPVINRELAELIENSTPSIRKKETLTLKIKSGCIDEEEKKLYSRAIKQYYTERYMGGKIELMRDYIIAGILAVVGMLVLILAFFVEDHSTIWSEVIDIVAWVFIWEAVYIAFLETRRQKQSNRKYIAYVSMNIEYIDK
jgi:hypothetical protein